MESTGGDGNSNNVRDALINHSASARFDDFESAGMLTLSIFVLPGWDLRFGRGVNATL